MRTLLPALALLSLSACTREVCGDLGDASLPDDTGVDGGDTADSGGGDNGAGDNGGGDSGGGDTGSGDSGGGDTGGGDTGEPPAELDLHLATIYDNPPDLADWPVGTRLTRVVFGNDGVHVEFSKQDGEGRWPDVVPPGWDGPLQYTLGLAEKIDGQWYASACIQYWYGLYESGGNVAVDNQIAVNWYYDARWGRLEDRQPATGEIVGLFVVAGNVRGVTDGSQSPVVERSDVVLFPFPGPEGAEYTFE